MGVVLFTIIEFYTSLAAKGALAHRLQRRTAAPPLKSKMATRGPQKWQKVRCLSLDFVRSCQISLNNFFDPNNPSMRKVDDGGEKRGKLGRKEENNYGNIDH